MDTDSGTFGALIPTSVEDSRSVLTRARYYRRATVDNAKRDIPSVGYKSFSNPRPPAEIPACRS